jgi:hypothetical protein
MRRNVLFLSSSFLFTSESFYLFNPTLIHLFNIGENCWKDISEKDILYCSMLQNGRHYAGKAKHK